MGVGISASFLGGHQTLQRNKDLGQAQPPPTLHGPFPRLAVRIRAGVGPMGACLWNTALGSPLHAPQEVGLQPATGALGEP